MVTPARRVFFETYPLYYPFGNTHSKNVFENVSFEIGADQRNYVTKILFLGCGDLRNKLQATSSTKHSHLKTLHIHLNDLNYSIMARNILILKIISTDFNPNNQEDVDFLWDVWYNAEWPESTRKRFQQALRDLLDGCLPENVVTTKSSQLQHLREVWTSWSAITADDHSKLQLLMKTIKSERLSFIMTSWDKVSKAPLDRGLGGFSSAIDGIMLHVGNNVGLEDLPKETAQKISGEFRFYFETGSCRLKSKVTTVCINPTMLNPKSLRWHVHYTLCPFDGYVPLRKEELEMSAKDGILIRSCQKILKNLVSSYRKHMDDVKLFFHLEDALELCYTGTNEMFDIIDCSNLADHVGLANLLNATSRRLSDAPGSVLFTETMTWRSLAPSVSQYLEQALCVPLNMIPTVYGLQQLNHVELGSLMPLNIKRLCVPPVNLFWGKAPSFQNISLQSSPTLTRCLQQLITRCFLVKDPKKMKPNEPQEKCAMLCYTPLTFYCVVSSLIQRVGDQWFNEVLNKLNFDPMFDLSRRTAEAWKKGEKIVKLSTTVPFDQFGNSVIGTPALRLVLFPLSAMGPAFILQTISNGLSSDGVHYIDNLQVEVRNSANGEIKTADLSFLLAEDCDLQDIHFGYVFDLISGLPVFFLPTMTSLRVEEFCLPYPFGSKGSQLPIASSQMVVDSCVESHCQYSLKISIGCVENVSGLKVATNQQKPCESAHRVTLSLSQPQGIKPLTLSFPHPFLVDDINATLYRKDRCVKLVMNKAVKEPWPIEFGTNNKSKLVVQQLKPWDDTETLGIHLATQFSMSMLKNPLESKKSALDEVREIIKSIFFGSCVNGQEYFGVRRQESPAGSSDWFVRVHPPIRTTPAGSPILLVSTVDHRLAENLANQGKLDKRKSAEDFFRIMGGKEQGLLTSLINSEEEAQLWRYVLRLNSTKMVPSPWQKKNLPLGENSPWLATFISPLYVDFFLEYHEMGSNEQSVTGKMATVKESCASCKKTPQNSKRCSRCRVVVYCSVECQRAHWSEHKIVCFKK